MTYPNNLLMSCALSFHFNCTGADLLVSCVTMPAIAYVTLRGQWEFSDAVCVTLGFLTMLTFVASVMSLAAISINRFYIVCRPQEVARKYTKLMTALWFAGKMAYTLVLIDT